MKYCVDLDIGMPWILKDPDYLNKLSVDKVNPNHFYLPITDLKDEFLSWLDQLNLKIHYSEIFYCPANGNIFKHSDCIDPLDSCKVNWVYDQGETYMRWFTLTSDAELKLRNNFIGGHYYSCDRDDQYFLDYQHRIQKPTLVNAAVPHDVINYSDFDRWAISLVFIKKDDDKRIGYSELIKILSPYLISPSGKSI
jgi:hypothetical protein